MTPHWASHYGSNTSVSDSHCKAKQGGLSEQKWKKEFEILAVESCVLVVVLGPASSTALVNKGGYESKKDEAMGNRGVTPATTSSTSCATRSVTLFVHLFTLLFFPLIKIFVKPIFRICEENYFILYQNISLIFLFPFCWEEQIGMLAVTPLNLNLSSHFPSSQMLTEGLYTV